MRYAEIINSGIHMVHEGLPISYNNISNFFALSNQEPLVVDEDPANSGHFNIPEGMTEVDVTESGSKVCCLNGWTYHSGECCPLYDLTWSGNEGAKFYPYIQENEVPENHTIVSTEYRIDDEAKIVYGTVTTEKNPPPSTITATQIRLWLVENGISLATIEAAINDIEDPLLKEKTLVQWEYAPYVERNHPFIETIGSVLGMTAEQIDDAFLEASLIT
jgi:hypothetical protein